MKDLFFLISITLLLSCNSNQNEIGSDDIVIQDVNVVNVENGEIQEQMTLVIRNGRISLIEEAGKIRMSNSDHIVYGRGKYLIPGLWDMHTHLINEPYTRKVFYPLFIANGITGIRVMAADCFEPCDEPNMTITQHRNLQDEILRGKLLGPRSILASYYINGTLSGESSVLKPRTEEHGRELALLLNERGVDFIKIYSELTPEAYHGITDEAKKIDLDFAGHGPLSLNSSEVSEAGQKSIEHATDNLLLDCSEIEDKMRAALLEIFDDSTPVRNINKLHLQMEEAFDSLKCEELYDIFRKNNTWIVPTLRLLEVYYADSGNWKDDPNIKYMPREEYEAFANDYGPFMEKFWGPFIHEVEERRRQMVADMNKAEVGLLAGSDVGEVGLIGGFSLHEELVSLQNAGLTPLEVLQTSTLNAARYQNATDSLGTIKTGNVADLVMLNGNPLEDIRKTQDINAVFVNGQYLNRMQLDSLLLSVETYIKNE